jgi:multidrug efflux pump
MESGYQKWLGAFMKVRWVSFLIIGLCVVSAYFIGTNIQSELAPMEDRNQFRLQLSAVEGTSYDYMDQYVQDMVQFIMDSIPEHKTALSVTAPGFTGSGSVNSGFVRVTLTEPNERNRSQQEIVNAVSKNLGNFPQGRAFPIQEQTIAVNRREVAQCSLYSE